MIFKKIMGIHMEIEHLDEHKEFVRNHPEVKIELTDWTHPQNIDKYYGHIVKRKYGTFRVAMKKKGIDKTFKTINEAEQYVKDNNDDSDVKNMYRLILDIHGLYFEVKLTQGQIGLVDCENFNDLENNCWFADKGDKTYYMKRNSEKTHIRFHNIVMNHYDFKKYTVDHFDYNGLNNRRYNLSLKNKQEQCVHRTLQKSNKSGYKGISFDKQSNSYKGQYYIEKYKNTTTKRFYVKDYNNEEECKLSCYNYLQDIKRKLPHYKLEF